MEALSIWGSVGLLVLFVVYLGYRRSKTGYLIFVIVIGLVLLFAAKFFSFLRSGTVGRNYSDLTGSDLNIDPLGPFQSIFNKFSYSADYSDIALVIVLVAVFFLTQFVKMLSDIFLSAKPKESDKRRRKRVLKNYGLKSITDIQKFD